MKKNIVVFAVLAIIFFYTSACLAAPVDPSKINVPKESGRIVEVYKSANPNAPVIVYLQDIHSNYEAQKAEAAILESLVRNDGFDLMLLEGKQADSNKDFKYLREQAPLESRINSAEDLLKDGTIACQNYLDLTTDLAFTITGVEDMKMYKKAREDHLAIIDKSAEMVKLTDILKNIASNLKLHIYSKEMRDLDDKIAAYNKDEIGLIEYVKTAQTLAAANNIDVKALPNVALFIDASAQETNIDFAAVETERAKAIADIEKAVTDPKAKEDFTAKNLKFRTGDISQGEFYSYLKDTAAAAKVDLAPSKNLNAYTQYITTYEKIDTNVLFKELDQLVDNVKNAMLKTPEEKQLSKIDKGLSILSDMVNTKLVPDEYNYFTANKAEFDIKGWLEFMKTNSAKFALTNPVPDDAKVLEDNLGLLEKFYAESIDRDSAFITNIKAKLAAMNKDKAVFICGGFHTPNMKSLLKDSGFSYVVVAPRVDVVKNYEDIYKAQIKEDMEYLNTVVPPENSKQ